MRVTDENGAAVGSSLSNGFSGTVKSTVERLRRRQQSLHLPSASQSAWEKNKYTSRMLSSWDRNEVRDFSAR